MIPDKIKELIDRFNYNLKDYKKGKFNETQVRREFIDPFFKQLGWDMKNENGYAEAYKDVIHEDSIKVEGKSKAPDYCFRIGGARKFFLEAKKPSVNIKEDSNPSFQLRRYGWSAKLPISILTDFEEFAVYDCRIKPEKKDKASKARIFYCNFRDYETNWDEIINTFSRGAILKGAFDKYTEKSKNKRGSDQVDKLFLKEIESWRFLLAKHIAFSNKELTQRELNFTVQKTIDRLIFLRICEDRGIENYGNLKDTLKKDDPYKELTKIFKKADSKYNSGIFHFTEEKSRNGQVDNLTSKIKIEKNICEEIITNLYYPDSPYEFSVIPPDILGQVYEKFLGKKIILNDIEGVRIVEKPDVVKAGGVYYTPTYIVQYLIHSTLSNIVNGKKPTQISKIAILDPSCGSGSFLIEAYQFLLDIHLSFYLKNSPEELSKKRNSPIYLSGEGNWKLTIEERKRILLNNIYGVDIDSQAVEVTKLSLLLKVLEGENEQSIGKQLRLFSERVLPDLNSNIKCGNSLIDFDYYDGIQLTTINKEELFRVNSFNWKESFPRVFSNGKFDLIIGNPPYGALFEKEDKDYLKRKYETIVGKFDSYGFFVEQGIKLLKENGFLAYIMPHTWLTIIEAITLREYLLQNTSICEIDRLPTKVFEGATVNTVNIILQKKKRKKHDVKVLLFGRKDQLDNIDESLAIVSSFKQNEWNDTEAKMFNINIINEEKPILKKVKSSGPKFETLCDFCVGIQAYDSYAGQSRDIIDNRIYHSTSKNDKTFVKELNGKDVGRYNFNWGGQSWVSYGDWLAHPRKPYFFKGDRILVREITGVGRHSIFGTFINEDYINYKTILNVKIQEKSKLFGYNTCYFLAIINSSLMSWYFPRASNKLVTKTFPRISILDLKRFPIKEIDFNNEKEKKLHDNIVDYTKQIMKIIADIDLENDPQMTTILKRQVSGIDLELDKKIYRLYNLSEAEINVIENVITLD